MQKTKKRILSAVAVILVFVLLALVVFLPKQGVKVQAAGDVTDLYAKLSYQKNENTYDAYLASHSDLQAIAERMVLPIGKKYAAGESCELSFESVAGWFEIEMKYRADQSEPTALELAVMLNGSLPFYEATGIKLPIYYEHQSSKTDERGNQYAAELYASETEITAKLFDATGYHQDVMLFAAQNGTNTLSFQFKEGAAELIEVALIPKGAHEVLSAPEQAEDHAAAFRVQAEYPLYRSDTSILEVCDRTTPATDPVFDGLQIWNALGGTGWSAVGQKVVWQFDVKKSGYYSLNIRYRQNYLSGRASYRTLLIDDKLLEDGLSDLKFAYHNGWQVLTLTDAAEKPVTVYLSAGTHTMAMETTLGEEAEIVNLAQQALYELNTIYRKFVMQTGANPDEYRDYQIEKKMPDVLAVMKSNTEILQGIYSLLYGQETGEDSAAITKLIWQLQEFLKEPDTIPASMASFQSNITAFGAWLQEKTSEPLCIDYFEFTPAGGAAPKADAGFFARLIYGTKQFFRSFSDDYGVIGAVYNDKEAMTVWLTLGRDQYQILKEQIDNDFTAKNGIPVNLKLVSGGLLESISAGIAPDVYLFGSEADPVNFAARDALVNLTSFEDFGTAAKQFHAEAIVPFTYNGGVYALPVSQDFLMMYVREDIFEEMGLQVPNNWQDFYCLLPLLQQNHMEFGFPTPANSNINSFALMLFQSQRQLYRDGGKTVALDTNEALSAFETWTKFYTDYSFLVDYNFVNRFRMGDMPIGIGNLTIYNTLQVSAPEINGMWNMYPIPKNSADDPCGYSVNILTSAFILKQTEREKQAWEFLKWFTGEEQQLAYATAIENLQGASARFSTANIAAFNQLPFAKSTLERLELQRGNAISVQQVPGGYFLARHVDNIYRAVKNNGEDVRQTVLEYTGIINAELTRKRIEFGLEAAE